jgi:Astacin (Peptidase family M12A)/FG-GAP repeat
MALKHLLTSIPLLAACLEAPDDEPAGELIVTEEGAWGHVRMQTEDGPMTLSYRVVGGHAIHELDIDLGPVEALRTRGGAARLGRRWPDSKIRFSFDENFTGMVCEPGMVSCVNPRTRIRQILAEMETKLPLRFVEVPIETVGCFGFPECDAVVFKYDVDLGEGGHSSALGMQGGIQYIRHRWGHEGDGASPLLLYSLQPVAKTVKHEMLHAAGLWHEQSRNDRNEFIQLFWENIEDGQGNGDYEIKSESADLGPYDFASLMHYHQHSSCAKDALGVCLGLTMVPIPPGAVIDMVLFGGFSIEDSNTVHRMYAREPGKNDAGDEFGKVLARGDFDGDGYDDLAVGIPGEDLATGVFPNIVVKPNAGRVSLWKGTSFGLLAWFTLEQSSYPGQSITSNAKFGTALAAYDANADGITDLAIGAPGALNTAGAVFVFAGSRAQNLPAHRFLSQASTLVDDDMAGDRFGEALAAGPLTGVIRVDSCATNRRYDALAVGAPGDTSNGSTAPRGAVFIYQETVPSCSTTSALSLPTALRHVGHTGAGTLDEFGSVLAMGDVDGDTRVDLAIGAPMFNSGKGKVYLYKGVEPSPVASPFTWSAMAIEADQLEASLTSRFGAAIAIGAILPVGRQVVVGAPGGAGKVIVWTGIGTVDVSQTETFTDAAPKSGDEFGAALAIANIDPKSEPDDLVVGVPGKDGQAGAVVVFQGGTNGLPVRTKIVQSSPILLGDREAGDRFGAAFAHGHFNGAEGRLSIADTGVKRRDLVIGAPGEKPELSVGVESPNQAGAFDFYSGQQFTLPVPMAHRHQEVAGRASTP